MVEYIEYDKYHNSDLKSWEGSSESLLKVRFQGARWDFGDLEGKVEF